MEPKEAKEKLKNILGSQLIFNKQFDRFFSILKENMQTDLIKWCNDCKEDKAEGSVPDNPKYKDRWVFFRKIGNGVRCVLIKVKNSDFIEIHLFNHKSYDDLRIKLGYKKSSYYGS